MAITRVSSGRAGSANNNDVTLTLNTLTATQIVVVYSYQTGVTMTLSDGQSNSWTQFTAQDSGTSSVVERMAYLTTTPITNASHTFTVSGTGSFPAIAVIAYKGTTSNSYDSHTNGVHNTSGSPVTTLATGSSGTPSEDNCVIVSGCGSSHLATAATGLSIQQSIDDGNNWCIAIADVIQTTAGAVNSTWSFASGNAGATIAVFKSSAATVTGASHYYATASS